MQYNPDGTVRQRVKRRRFKRRKRLVTGTPGRRSRLARLEMAQPEDIDDGEMHSDDAEYDVKDDLEDAEEAMQDRLSSTSFAVQ